MGRQVIHDCSALRSIATNKAPESILQHRVRPRQPPTHAPQRGRQTHRQGEGSGCPRASTAPPVETASSWATFRAPCPHPSNVSCFVRATTPVLSHQDCKGICRAQPLGIGRDGGNREGLATTDTQERGRPSPCLQHPGSNPVLQLCSAAEPSLTRETHLGASQVLR